MRVFLRELSVFDDGVGNFCFRVSMDMLSNKKLSTGGDSGFTMIELLVTMSVVAALTAIAIPQFQGYRQRAFDLRAELDLRHVAIAEEAYYLDNEEYLACAQDQCTDLPGVARLSEGTQLSIEVTDEAFIGLSSHPKGTGRVMRWDSANGGLVP
jgi:prepilin-type N-terminal cleavage/methylation domain-containing protein